MAPSITKSLTTWTMASALCLLPVTLVQATGARNYILQDSYVGVDFLNRWDHQAIPDPTNGRVLYVNETVALASNLTFVSSDTLIMRADYTSILAANDTGRPSIRLISQQQYSTSVTVLDLRHMPQGCSTWPAFWTTSATADWPTAGEIDIIEGINDLIPNASTLHTTANCSMTAGDMKETGSLVANNCDHNVASNTGCQVKVDKSNSYGPPFNANGGGWYAMERTSSFINIYFWPRNDASVPADVSGGALTVNPAHWGKPIANFVDNNCDISSKFGPNNLIFDLTFCGDWAGNAYPASCPSASGLSGYAGCVDYVNNNPAAFANAFWDVASVRVYSPGCSLPAVHKRNPFERHHRSGLAHGIIDSRELWEL